MHLDEIGTQYITFYFYYNSYIFNKFNFELHGSFKNRQ